MNEDYRFAIGALKAECAPDRVKHNLLVAFRRRKRFRLVGRWSLGAVAAAIFLAAVVGAYQMRETTFGPPAPLLAHIAAPAPVATATATVTAAASPVVRVRPRTVKRPEEIATPYYALPGADSLPSPDAEAVVRMLVPRSTLQLVGFPGNEAPQPELIRADVVIGQDGMARAIRFVQ